MTLNKGVVEAMEVKSDRQTTLKIDGKFYGAFNRHHETAKAIKVGDTVSYAFVVNGKYNNLEALSLLSAGNGAAITGVAGGAGGASPREYVTKDESVLVSYAKDVMIGGITKDPKEAVALVMALVDIVHDYTRPTK